MANEYEQLAEQLGVKLSSTPPEQFTEEEVVPESAATEPLIGGEAELEPDVIEDSEKPTPEVEEPVEALRERMEQEGIDSLAVVENDGRFVGWVGVSDLKRGRAVKDIMNSSSTTSTINAFLNEALSLMLSSGLKALPVVGEDNRLEGVLTLDAIQKALHEAVQAGELK